MKYIVALIISSLPLFVSAQNDIGNNMLQSRRDTLIFNLINDLKVSWNLGINNDVTEPVDIREFNKFKNLFDSIATIDDEFNVVFKYDTVLKKPVYLVDSNKPFDVYAHDIALQVVSLKIDTDSMVTKNFFPVNTEKEIYEFEIFRKVSVSKLRKYALEDGSKYFDYLINDREINNKNLIDRSKLSANKIYSNSDATYQIESQSILKITFNVINDSTIKITKIKNLTKPLITIKNDFDKDGVLDNEDMCDSVAGDFSSNGCPDNDFDGIKDHDDHCKYDFGESWNHGCPWNYFGNKWSLSGFTGFVFNSCAINLPEPDKAGYSSVVDMNESKKGNITNPGIASSSIFGIDISYFFGTKKNKGISIGINYSGFQTSYEISDDVIYTFRSNDGNPDYDYRRRVTIKQGSEEQMDYQVFNFPVLFKYRGRFKESDKEIKWSYELSAGPSLVYFNNTSDYNVNIDFEGLYQVDSVKKNSFKYYDYFDNGSTWNVLLTSNDINSQSTNPGFDSLFNQLNKSGYDYAANKTYKGNQNVKRVSIAINANADFYYQLNNYAIKFGAGIVIARSLNSSSGYLPMNKTSDRYNSFLRTKSDSFYVSYGAHFGLVYNFK